MKNIKKIFAIGTMVLTLGVTSMTVMASPSNPGIPARDGSGGRRSAAGTAKAYDGIGRGQGGVGRGLGIGGQMLQDGSCYTTN